jgi:RHS repeat-associated protein
VLSDGTNTYLYGLTRIGEEQPGSWQYHLSDALGSVRQLANSTPAVTLARSYKPFGDSLTSAGTGATTFQFTGQQRDGTGLAYLRARYYLSREGLFIAADQWAGNYMLPMSLNAWLYVLANPINLSDPSGMLNCSMLPVEDRVFCILEMGGIKGSFPPAPAGQNWADIGSDWVVSGYVYALESEYSGSSYETELGAKIKAKWDFLFSRDGVVMQGTGILRSGQVIHIDNFQDLYWADQDGNNTGVIDHVGNPEQARFALGYGGPGYRMREYYHVAAPRDIPKGTYLYIPAIEPYTPYGGVVKVVDRGGQITGHRLDLFVGEGKRPGYDWNVGRYDIRLNVQVYRLTWGSECK